MVFFITGYQRELIDAREVSEEISKKLDNIKIKHTLQLSLFGEIMIIKSRGFYDVPNK